MKNINKILLSVFSVVFVFAAQEAMANKKAGPSEQNKLLAKARAATAKYHDVNVAFAEGYQAAEFCVPGMGYHFVKPTLLFIDPENGDFSPEIELNELTPEILLYEDGADGGLKLVGVEYFTADVGQEHPYLFISQLLNGPMDGHEPGMPSHYDLHVWLWKNNPDGLFAPFNTTVNCN